MNAVQLGRYRAVLKSAADFGPDHPAVPAGAAGTFVLTGFNPYGHPWGLFTTDEGFTFNKASAGLEVDYEGCDIETYRRSEAKP